MSEFTTTECPFVVVYQDNGQTFYGGNQNWFYNDIHNKPADKHIMYGGCGLIALCNIYLTLDGRLRLSCQEYEDYLRSIVKSGTAPIDMSGLLRKIPFICWMKPQKIEKLSNKITKNTDTLGMFTLSICSKFNRKYKSKGLAMRFLPADFTSFKRMKQCIYDCISNKLPIIFSLSYGAAVDYTLYESDGTSKQYKSMSWHFITVTGASEQPDGKTLITFSSWGKKGTLYLEDFMKKPGFCGGILYICQKR